MSLLLTFDIDVFLKHEKRRIKKKRFVKSSQFKIEF